MSAKHTNAPWLTEPDAVDFTSSGLPCAIRRGPAKALCGYVGVPASHPLHSKGYSDTVKAPDSLKSEPLGKRGIMALLCAASDLEAGLARLDVLFDVHGSLTYADKHCPEGGEAPEGFWWFGFDCSHCDDLCPAYDSTMRSGVYRDIEYVRAECESLAKQLAEYTS